MNYFRRLFANEFDALLAYPALIWQVYFMYAPLFVMLWFSLIDPVTKQWTLKHYVALANWVYLGVVWRSCMLATATSVICLLLGYPLAYFIALKAKRFRTMLLFFLILPSWTNIIVQMYAWFFLLQKQGIFYNFLLWAGLATESTRLLNTTGATVFGLVYCFLPFMTLPLYAVLEKMDKKLLEASADLGATHVQTFWHVVVPISMPGIAAGTLLVFIPTFGEFAIPELLGGSKNLVWGSVIVSKFVVDRDFNGGAALAYLGVGFFATVVILGYLAYKLFKYIEQRVHAPRVPEAERLEDDWGSFHG